MTVQERYGLCTGALSIRCKGIVAHSVGDAVIHSPLNSRCVVCVSIHIVEFAVRFYCRRALRAPQERYDLCAAALSIRSELGIGDAVGDALLYCPQYCVVVIHITGYIREGHIVVLCYRTTGCSPQERYNLCTGAYHIGTECGIGNTVSAFKGNKVTVEVYLLGNKVGDDSFEGKYAIKDDEITFTYENSKGEEKSQTLAFEELEDGSIKIGAVTYKKAEK